MKVMIVPVRKDFKLKSDPEGVARVTFCQATFGIQMRRAELYKTRRTIAEQNGDGVLRYWEERGFNAREQAAWDIYLTLVEASGFKRPDGEEAFTFNAEGLSMDWEAFIRVLSSFDEPVVDEMYECLLEVNPDWGPPKKPEASVTKTESSPEPRTPAGSTGTSAKPETP